MNFENRSITDEVVIKKNCGAFFESRCRMRRSSRHWRRREQIRRS